MGLKQMSELLAEKYDTQVTAQGIYLWLQKYDLLKYRGKGKKRGANMQKRKGQTIKANPKRAREAAMRKAARKRKF